MSEIVHIVMWRLNGATARDKDNQAEEIIQAFEQSRLGVQGLLRLEIGRNINKGSDAWDLALYMLFQSEQHLEAYQAHPAHLAIKDLVGPMRTARCQVDFRK